MWWPRHLSRTLIVCFLAVHIALVSAPAPSDAAVAGRQAVDTGDPTAPAPAPPGAVDSSTDPAAAAGGTTTTTTTPTTPTTPTTDQGAGAGAGGGAADDAASPPAATAPAEPAAGSGDVIDIPDVTLCDCGFKDTHDPRNLLWTSYYHVDFRNMTQATLLTGMRPLSFSIDRETSDYRRSIEPGQVQMGPRGVELKVSPLQSDNRVPSATLSSVTNDFWYGNYHVRALTSNHTGTVAAFYTYYNDTQECDIEYVGKDSNQRLRFTTKPQHYDALGRPSTETYAWQKFPSPHGESMSDDFRFWSFQWLPDIVYYGLDLTYASNLTHEVQKVPGYVLISHWSDGNPLFSGGPPLQDTLFTISDVISIYNSSEARLPFACQHVQAPCSVDVSARTITVPADKVAAPSNVTSKPVQPYVGTLINVNAQPIDWNRGHRKFGQTKWKVIVVIVCGCILGILVIACLWNFDGFMTRLCGSGRRRRGGLGRQDSLFAAIKAAARKSDIASLASRPLGGGPGRRTGPVTKVKEEGVPMEEQSLRAGGNELSRRRPPLANMPALSTTMSSSSPLSNRAGGYQGVPGGGADTNANANGDADTSTDTDSATLYSARVVSPRFESSADSYLDLPQTLEDPPMQGATTPSTASTPLSLPMGSAAENPFEQAIETNTAYARADAQRSPSSPQSRLPPVRSSEGMTGNVHTGVRPAGLRSILRAPPVRSPLATEVRAFDGSEPASPHSSAAAAAAAQSPARGSGPHRGHWGSPRDQYRNEHRDGHGQGRADGGGPGRAEPSGGGGGGGGGVAFAL
ncbi:unnamed protein product [Parajaminaea phylloscopi]